MSHFICDPWLHVLESEEGKYVLTLFLTLLSEHRERVQKELVSSYIYVPCRNSEYEYSYRYVYRPRNWRVIPLARKQIPFTFTVIVFSNFFPFLVVILQVNLAPFSPVVSGSRGRAKLWPPSSLSSTGSPTPTNTHSILTTWRLVVQLMLPDNPTITGVSWPVISTAIQRITLLCKWDNEAWTIEFDKGSIPFWAVSTYVPIKLSPLIWYRGRGRVEAPI